MNLLFVALAVFVLIVLAGGGCWWYARARARWADSLQATQQQASQHHLSLAAHHAREVQALTSTHQSRVSQLKAAHQAQVADLTAMNEQLEKNYAHVREHISLEIGERSSRAAIVAACRHLEMDAVVLSNVVFVTPSPDDYFAQIDHLVVTPSLLLIIESKYWQGVVIDGVDISDEAPDLARLLAPLLTQAPLQDRANRPIHLRSGGMVPGKRNEEQQLHASIRPSSAAQARRQAVGLRRYLLDLGIPCSWVNACVYYCHPESVVMHADWDDTTAIVSDAESVERRIKVLAASNTQETVDVRAVVKELAPHSTDVTGTGRFSQRWKSVLERHQLHTTAEHGLNP